MSSSSSSSNRPRPKPTQIDLDGNLFLLVLGKALNSPPPSGSPAHRIASVTNRLAGGRHWTVQGNSISEKLLLSILPDMRTLFLTDVMAIKAPLQVCPAVKMTATTKTT